MIYKVDFTQPQWRSLYGYLYDKVLGFALAHGWSEADVIMRFTRLIHNDPFQQLLVDFFTPQDPT